MHSSSTRLALLLAGAVLVSAPASAQHHEVPGLRSVRRALSERHETPAETDAGAVEIRARGDVYQVAALFDVRHEHHVDVHHDVLVRQRFAQRIRLCDTPCRLVINEPLLLDVEGIDLEIAPETQRQRWLVLPERRGLRMAARVVAAAGFLSAVVGLVFWRKGAAIRTDAFSSDEADANFRGGLVGFVLGTALFIGGTTAARRLRGRAVREY